MSTKSTASTATTTRPERVSHAIARDVTLPGGAGTLALVTIDNGLDHTKPTTLGPEGLAELHTTLETLRRRAADGEIVAVAITGKPYFLAAGADLTQAAAVQVLAFLDHFGIADDDERVNQYGGAIAMGHPLASSGVRLMTQLARQFEQHPEVRYGLTTMCVGLGMGGTVIWENPHHADYSGHTFETAEN